MTPPPVAAIVVNYNMPERTDALYDHLLRTVNYPIYIQVVDNGSDLTKPSSRTTCYLDRNIQTTNGWLKGIEQLPLNNYLAYWFIITSASFPNKNVDPLAPMAHFLLDNPLAVGIHPSLTPSSTTNWNHMKNRGLSIPRPTFMIDNITSLYRTDWFDGIGRFDPSLTFAWGIDLETCYKARQQRRSLWIDERIQVEKITDIGYKMKRMNMSARERSKQAGLQMATILSAKYGTEWMKLLTKSFVTKAMK